MAQLDPFAACRSGTLVEPAAATRMAQQRAHALAGLMRPVDDLDLTVRASNCVFHAIPDTIPL
jgi:DNA-directed RNA polymerase alpha subunit